MFFLFLPSMKASVKIFVEECDAYKQVKMEIVPHPGLL
jgi:hypothetical protein